MRTLISQSPRIRGRLLLAGFLLLPALPIAAWSSAQGTSSQAASPTTTSPATSATSSPQTSAPATPPTSAGLKHIDQAALQAMVDTTARELLIPGVVVLLRTPQGEFAVTYGTTLLGAKIPPSADTHFRVASNTKTMTSAVILQLAQEDKLSLDDPGVEVRRARAQRRQDHPRRAAGNAQWPLQLHRCPRNFGEPWTMTRPGFGPPAELLAIAFAHPPNVPPGTAYEYNNTNYLLLSLIAEKVDGKPLAQSMQDRLFGPLHLQQTEFPAPTVNTIPRLTRTATCTEAPRSPWWAHLHTRLKYKAAARAGTLLPNDYTNVNHSFAEGAGAVISTANDLATWIEALVAGRVLNATYQRRWLDSLQPEDPSKPKGQQYGYGITQMSLGTEHYLFSRRRDRRLQLVHGPRPQQPGDARGLDQPDRIARRKADRQYLMLKVLDQIYVVSPLAPAPSPTASTGSR